MIFFEKVGSFRSDTSYDMVVKGHNGNIQVDSTEGTGSTFIISLPVN